MLSYNCKEGDNPEGLPVVILILVSGQLSGEVEVKCEHVTFVVVIIFATSDLWFLVSSTAFS